MFQSSFRIALAALDRPASQAQWLDLVTGLHEEPGFWWLDSALQDGRLGRFSFAGANPYLWLRSRGAEVEIEVERGVRPGLTPGYHRYRADPIECARALLPRADSILYSTRTNSRLAGSGDPSGSGGSSDSSGAEGRSDWREVTGLSDGLDLPFLGGAVGYFGYELANELEPRVEFRNPSDLGLPDLSLAFVDRVLAYDPDAERLWLVGLGFGGASSRDGRGWRSAALARSRACVDTLEAQVDEIFDAPRSRMARVRSEDRVAEPASIRSTSDASGYAKAVDAILEEIAEGNVYQANFSQRLTTQGSDDPWPLYEALRVCNPAPFGAYLSLPDGTAILSSSPERFLRVDDGRSVESRPIKGTRSRGEDEAEDRRLAEELATSEKDRAENLMIVDLVRNDLGRVCAPGSIRVPELMEIEAYAAVFQMVSTVKGMLAPGRDAFDLIEATFPPGSMTGAPKLAAIELLDRLESVRRGVYAGALGYLDLRGGLDLSVVIRTIVWKEGMAHLHVGGGVVADSSPHGEYLESLDKARAPLAALDRVREGTAQCESGGEGSDDESRDAGEGR